MKALICYGPGQYQLEDVKSPIREEQEVKLRVLYAGICGSDLGIFHGLNPFVNYPLIPGHEFCGEIIESENPGLPVGRLVAVMPVVGCGKCPSCQAGLVNRCSKVRLYGVHMNGGFAEEVVVKESQVFPVESPIKASFLAFVEPLAVGVHCNRIGGIKRGSSVAIIGGGVIGLTILKVAVLEGASFSLVVDIVPDKLRKAQEMGASSVFDANDGKLVDFAQKVNEDGFDVVFDVVGNEKTLEDSLDILRPGGKLVLVAVPGSDRRRINLKKIFAQEKIFTASRTYVRDDFKKALDLILSGAVDPSEFISSEYSLKEIRKAIEAAAKGERGDLKILVKCKEG